MKNAVILCLLAVTIVSAQQKQRIAVLPSVGDLDPQRLILLTDKVREIATKNLPIENFNILKQDVITRMIGEEELYRSCKEGVCIGDLAKKTNANYGARCDVVNLDNSLVLKFELYSVNEEAIFETFTEYHVKDFYGMLDILDKRLPDAFKKMISVRNVEMAQPKPAAPPAPTVLPTTPPVQPAPPPPAAVSQPKPTSKPASGTTFTDSRDGKTYKKVTIGSQTWMAENLNFASNNSKCYENNDGNCGKYGRLYTWADAKAACPAGWHLPTDKEWTTLEKTVGGSKRAGIKLKSTSGWNGKRGNGTDDFGFSALPGGYGYSDGNFYGAGYYGGWWSATESDASNAWNRNMYYIDEIVRRNGNSKTYLFSVRCLQD